MDDPYIAAAVIALAGVIGAALIAGIFGLVRRNGRKNNRGNPGAPLACNQALTKLDQLALRFDVAIDKLTEIATMLRERRQ